MMPISFSSVVLILGAAVCLGLGYRMGHQSARADCAAEIAQSQAKIVEQANATVEQANARFNQALSDLSAVQKRLAAVDQAAALRQKNTTANFRLIEQGQFHHAQTLPAAVRDCRLDDDGLRLWRAANANDDPRLDAVAPGVSAPPDAASGIDAGLRGSAAANGGGLARAAGEPSGGGAAVSRVPGQADGAGRLGADQ